MQYKKFQLIPQCQLYINDTSLVQWRTSLICSMDTEITSQAIGQELPVSFIFNFSNKTRTGCWESSFPFGIFWKNKMVLKLSEGCVEQPAGNHWHHEIFPRATSPEIRHGTSSYRNAKLWHFPPEGAPTVHPAYSNPLWRAEILSKGKFLAWWWSREGAGQPYLCLREKDKEGFISLPFWMKDEHILVLKNYF